MNAQEELDTRTRLRMLVTLRKIVAETKKSGFVSPENVHTLNTIGFSVITWLYDDHRGAWSVEVCRRFAEGGDVSYKQLKATIKANTMNYTVAPWGGPLGESEIYGSHKPHKPSALFSHFLQMCAVACIGVFLCTALGYFKPITAVLLWTAIAILTLLTLLIKGIRNDEN